jgi:hypothetical protein
VNHTLNRDGSVDSNEANLLAVWKDKLTDALKGGQDASTLRKAMELSQKVQEIEEHMAQKRFLFIPVDAAGDIVYYQCAVPGNPDVRMS